MTPTFVITLPILWSPGMAVFYAALLLLALYGIWRLITGLLGL